MIDPQTVFENAKVMLNISEDEEDKLMGFCNISAKNLSKRLKDGFTGDEHEAVYACAAFAIYRYSLLKSCLDDYCEYLKTGDITVTRSAAALLESAEKLLSDALSSADCFTDIAFIFKGI